MTKKQADEQCDKMLIALLIQAERQKDIMRDWVCGKPLGANHV